MKNKHELILGFIMLILSLSITITQFYKCDSIFIKILLVILTYGWWRYFKSKALNYINDV